MEEQARTWIDSTAAAERLGVKPATLYAYVSRGVLRRRHGADGRRSLFDAAEVEDLARRGRPRHRPGPEELSIESKLTDLGKDRPYYRGRDALQLVGSHSYESVAEWLWTGRPDVHEEPWRSLPAAVRAAVTAQSGLPGDALPIDRLQIIVTTLGVTDPMRFHLDPGAVIATGQTLVAGMVDALPAVSSPAVSAGDTIAGRLWGRLSPASEPEPDLLKALDAALILLADHELAASTLAARVAASVKADPYAVVAAGLGVLSGPMHGGASLGVERMLAETHDPAQAPRVIGERLRQGDRIPGAGHSVYKSGDARGTFLFDLIRSAVPGHERLAAAEALLAELRARRLPEPNIDFAVATLAAVTGMVTGAGEAIFAVARTAGWLAHALEEYERRSPLRPRAVYTGPPPITS
ncbi:MAG: citrate synthase [Streptosporangiaceae bacterium]|jgi:citrate synthase|nr:citrate synthase [Streptosporangiaceae bacterium]